MKRTWRELNEREGRDDDARAALIELTWPQARAKLNGETLDEDFDADNWKQQKAQAVIDLYAKAQHNRRATGRHRNHRTCA